MPIRVRYASAGSAECARCGREYPTLHVDPSSASMRCDGCFGVFVGDVKRSGKRPAPLPVPAGVA